MKISFNKAMIGAATLLMVAACTKNPQWTLNGAVEGAEDGIVVLEAANGDGFWYTVDSLKIGSDGSFSTAQPAQELPDIFRLNYNNRYIYFPIDSIDNLTINTKAGTFDSDFTIAGTPDADLINHVDHRINAFLASHRVEDLDTAATLKRELSGMILQNPASIVSYYIVQKQVKGRPLFRIDNRRELGMIGAVANAFVESRPNDPRTLFIKNMWLNHMPRTASRDTIVANEIQLIDIRQLDNKGKEQSLIDIASKNKVVVLNFTSYSDQYSQALNIALRKIWDKHHGNGLEVFQLGFDPKEFNWRVSADNQPWVTVYNGTTDLNLRNYNVGGLPAIFIIKNGQIVSRITDPEKLESSIDRYML